MLTSPGKKAAVPAVIQNITASKKKVRLVRQFRMSACTAGSKTTVAMIAGNTRNRRSEPNGVSPVNQTTVIANARCASVRTATPPQTNASDAHHQTR